MFCIQCTVSTSDARIFIHESLLDHMQTITECMRVPGAYHIITLNGDFDTCTIYSYEEAKWCIIKERPIEDDDWRLFQNDEEKYNPLFTVDVAYADEPGSNSHEHIRLLDMPRQWQENFTGLVDSDEFVSLEWTLGLTHITITKVDEPGPRLDLESLDSIDRVVTCSLCTRNSLQTDICEICGVCHYCLNHDNCKPF